MYQYKAKLKKNQQIIAEGHTLEDIEKQIVHFKREQKRGLHTNMNNQIEIIHVQRDQMHGEGKEKNNKSGLNKTTFII